LSWIRKQGVELVIDEPIEAWLRLHETYAMLN
jgi:hypothetical protein